MYKILVLEHKISGNKLNVFLSEPQWKAFNSKEVELRLFNLNNIKPDLNYYQFIGDDYAIINILELPYN